MKKQMRIEKGQVDLRDIKSAPKEMLDQDLLDAIDRSMDYPRFSSAYDKAKAEFELIIAKEETIRDLVINLEMGWSLEKAIAVRLAAYSVIRIEAEEALGKLIGKIDKAH